VEIPHALRHRRIHHEALAIWVKRRFNPKEVLEAPADLMILRGPPAYVRSDNDTEFIAKALRERIAGVGSQTAYIKPAAPGEHGYCGSFNSKLRDELLHGELFFCLAEAQILIEAWRWHYNGVRPHSSLGYRPPAPDSFVPRSGGVAPWANAPPLRETARPLTPIVASETAMN
jgi:putative transposase